MTVNTGDADRIKGVVDGILQDYNQCLSST